LNDCLKTLNKKLKEQSSIAEKKDKQIMSFEVMEILERDVAYIRDVRYTLLDQKDEA